MLLLWSSDACDGWVHLKCEVPQFFSGSFYCYMCTDANPRPPFNTAVGTGDHVNDYIKFIKEFDLSSTERDKLEEDTKTQRNSDLWFK